MNILRSGALRATQATRQETTRRTHTRKTAEHRKQSIFRTKPAGVFPGQKVVCYLCAGYSNIMLEIPSLLRLGENAAPMGEKPAPMGEIPALVDVRSCDWTNAIGE